MKTVVLDTNVILDRPFESILENFQEPTEIVLPLIVLEEMDTFKKGNDVKNEYARATTRFLDTLREKGRLDKGVPYKQHSIKVSVSPEELDLNKADYQIIKKAKDMGAELITQDINERVIADALGVDVKNFAAKHVDVDRLYSGYRDVEVTEDEYNKMVEWQSLGIDAGKRRFVDNQFVICKGPMGASVDGIYKKYSHHIVPLEQQYCAWGISPKKIEGGKQNEEQRLLMHLLLDPDIEFVSAIGPSGCGKTLLTLAAALEQTLNGFQVHGRKSEGYSKITVMRPLIPVGNQDIGFLPGSKLEKLEPWMASTFDALDYLLNKKEMKDSPMSVSSKEKIYKLIDDGFLDLEAMAHIRGRSIPNQFIIIDDAQNLTQQEATSIITRAGEGSKVVFLGDLSEKQIDNHRLTPGTNGLSYVIEQMKNDPIVGHVTLNTVVRSKLAQLGVERL